MFYDGISLAEGSVLINPVIDSGPSFPLNPSLGELFFKTTATVGLYIFDGTTWIVSGGGGGQSSFTVTGDVAGTLDGGTDTLTLATVNASPQSDAFRKITVNAKGLVTSTSAVSSFDITTALGYTPADSAGTTMTGPLILSGEPTSSLQAATKQYVDDVASGLNIHASVATATTGALSTSIYNNGSSGVGATLTASVNGAIGTVGGYGSLALDDRVLVKNQANAAHNGIYVVSDIGSGSTPWVLTRATDFDNSPAAEVTAGDFVYVVNGTNAGTQWALTTSGTITIGTSSLNWSQLTPSTAGVTSLSGTANQVNVSGSTGAVTVSLPSSVTISGTMTAGTFSGSGANLTSIPNTALVSSSITVNGTSIALGGSGTVTAAAGTLTGTVLNNTVVSSSLTSVGTLAGLSVSGALNLSGGSSPLQVQGSAGSAGQVLTSAGPGSTPTWQTFSAGLDFSARYTELRNNIVADAGLVSIDTSLGNVFVITMAGNINTLLFTNIPANTRVYTMTLIIVQDATGNRTINWPLSVKWQNGITPVLSTSPNRRDVISLMTYDAGNTWLGFIGGQNFF